MVEKVGTIAVVGLIAVNYILAWIILLLLSEGWRKKLNELMAQEQDPENSAQVRDLVKQALSLEIILTVTLGLVGVSLLFWREAVKQAIHELLYWRAVLLRSRKAKRGHGLKNALTSEADQEESALEEWTRTLSNDR